jgi:hypothetical protein
MTASNFIFRPIPDKPETNTTSENFFCVFGEHEFLDDDHNPQTSKETPKTLAKSVQTTDSIRYFIKVGTHGRVYNPIGMYSEGKESKFLAKIGKNEWVFKSVNKDIFDKYVNFLRTKNIAWLNNAERDMI